MARPGAGERFPVRRHAVRKDGNGGFDDLAISGTGRYVRVSGTARATEYGCSLWEFGVYRS